MSYLLPFPQPGLSAGPIRDRSRAREGIRGTDTWESTGTPCPTLGQLPTSILPKPVGMLSRAEVDLPGPTFSDSRLPPPQPLVLHDTWYAAVPSTAMDDSIRKSKSIFLPILPIVSFKFASGRGPCSPKLRNRFLDQGSRAKCGARYIPTVIRLPRCQLFFLSPILFFPLRVRQQLRQQGWSHIPSSVHQGAHPPLILGSAANTEVPSSPLQSTNESWPSKCQQFPTSMEPILEHFLPITITSRLLTGLFVTFRLPDFDTLQVAGPSGGWHPWI